MIDAGNDEGWPEEVTAALPSFRQGSLVPRPPFLYQADTQRAVWEATRLSEEQNNDAVIALSDEDRPPFGIITTQSCDVDEEGANRKPWVQVAPVYELPADDRRIGAARKWAIHYFAPVPALGDHWVADLRIEVPVEKSWLVQQAPQPAFSEQAQFDRFSDHCGAYRSRRALATSAYDQILTPLNHRLQELRVEDPGVFSAFVARVTDVFAEVAGDTLAPTAIGLVFVSENALPGPVVEALEDWWAGRVADVDAFVFAPNRFLAFDQVLFAEFRRWYPLDKGRLASS